MRLISTTSLCAVVVWNVAAAGVLHAQQPNRARPAARAGAIAAEDPLIEAAKTTYAASTWPRGTRRNGLDLEALRLPDLVGGELELRFGSGTVARRYFDVAGTPRLLIELAVFDRIGAAHQALLRHIAFVQTPRTLPTAASLGIAAGDVGFAGVAGVAQDRVSWVAFVSGNLELRVSNLDLTAEVQPDLRGAIERLQALLATVESAGERGAVPRPTFERVVAAERGRVEQPVALEINVHDSLGAPVHLEFEVLKGQAEVVAEDPAGAASAQRRFTIVPGAAGPLEIRVHALGRHGTFAAHTLKLEVDPSR